METQLLLVRHAEAVRARTGGGDWERPLTRRGELEAQWLGGEIARRGWVPELVLASNAARAEQTAELLLAAWSGAARLVLDPQLYLAEPGVYEDVIRGTIAPGARLLIVGHNDGLSQFVTRLAKEFVDLSTGSAAVVSLRTTAFSAGLGPGGGSLVDVLEPPEMRI